MQIDTIKESLRHVRRFILFGFNISLSLSACAFGWFWAACVAFEHICTISFFIGTVGSIVLLLSAFLVNKIKRIDLVLMFSAYAAFTLFAPVAPYLPLIHSLITIIPMLTFLLLFMLVIIRLKIWLAALSSYLVSALTSLIVSSIFGIESYPILSGKENVEIALLCISVFLIVAVLFRRGKSVPVSQYAE